MILDTFQTVFITLPEFLDPDLCVHPRFTSLSIGYDKAKGGNVVYRFTRCKFDLLLVIVAKHLKELREARAKGIPGGRHG